MRPGGSESPRSAQGKRATVERGWDGTGAGEWSVCGGWGVGQARRVCQMLARFDQEGTGLPPDGTETGRHGDTGGIQHHPETILEAWHGWS